jgi:GABA(A) receptor-associated protein
MTSKEDITREKIQKILAQHPTRVPIIVRQEKSDDFSRFLVSEDCTVADFIGLIRKKNKLTPTEGIYIFVKSGKEATLPPSSSTIGSIYKEHKDENLVLNLVYAKENVFG